MATLSDTQLDLLLREAEERLQKRTSRQPSNSSPRPASTQITEADQPPKPDNKLSVRIPQKTARSEKANDSAGPGWFNLPKTDLTSEFKRDWQILRMRSILDPKHQMKTLKAEPPKFSQIGEVIAGPTDYFTARLTRKEKGKNLLEEAMRASNKAKLRTKYAGIQKNKRSGKKGFYQNLVQNRRRGK